MKCICEVDGEKFEGEPGDTICAIHLEMIHDAEEEAYRKELDSQQWADFFAREEQEAEERRQQARDEQRRAEWLEEQEREQQEQEERNRKLREEENL